MRTMRLMFSVLCMVLGLAWMAVPAVAQCEWSALGSGMGGPVDALTVFDDGTGTGLALFAGGDFTTAGGVAANSIAKWDGAQWSALSSGMRFYIDPTVSALTVWGQALYAGGHFYSAGGVSANHIAKWDGTQWSALGSGMNSYVSALTVFDDGTGSALYAGGIFTTAGGVPANNIAKWNGTQWSPVGSGMNGGVFALTVFDDGTGTGPALYAGGFFSTAGGVSANQVAKWDGTQWSALGSGMNTTVRALTVFDDGTGTGPALYAGGEFSYAGGVPANKIAKWDGTQWSALGSGITGQEVDALTVFDDGTGPALYAGGLFAIAGGMAAHHIAKWDGTQWSALGSEVDYWAVALTVFDDGTNPAVLYAGGLFRTAGGVPVNRIAKWGCTP